MHSGEKSDDGEDEDAMILSASGEVRGKNSVRDAC